MKRIIFLIAFVAVIGGMSASAQTAIPLSFTGDRAVITTADRYYIPQSVWSTHQTLYIDIVNALEPELGFEGWTGQNSWSVPGSSQWIGNTEKIRQQYIKIDVPGAWTNMYQSNSRECFIRRIANPTLTVGSDSKPLSQWGQSPINVPRGIEVKLNVDPFFVSGGGANTLNKSGTLHDHSKTNYDLTGLGNGIVNFELRTVDGANIEIYSNNFSLNYEDAATVPVQSVSLNKTSTTLTVGGEETLVATVNPTNATNQNVSWSSSNTTVATVENGKVKALTAGTAIITVTTQDGDKTATCDVTVNAKTYTLTATAGSGGTISPSGSVTVNQGGNQTFTATPDNGKMIDQWKVDGNVVASAGNTYTVSNVQANAAVQVTFKDTSDTAIPTNPSGNSTPTLSPNPTKSHLHISRATASPTHIEIYTLAAQRLLSKDFEGAEFDVDLSGCPAGVLVVRVSDGEQVGVYKIIKE
jgi:hypothetical protein